MGGDAIKKGEKEKLPFYWTTQKMSNRIHSLMPFLCVHLAPEVHMMYNNTVCKAVTLRRPRRVGKSFQTENSTTCVQRKTDEYVDLNPCFKKTSSTVASEKIKIEAEAADHSVRMNHNIIWGSRRKTPFNLSLKKQKKHAYVIHIPPVAERTR